MTIDPSELQAKLTGGPVAEDTRCRRCGYDLTGLSAHGKCPECGAGIGLAGASQGRFADNLADTPPDYLRQLMYSVLFLTVTAIALPFALTRAASAAGPAAVTNAAIFLAVAIAWSGAVFLVTLQRAKAAHTVKDATLDSPRFRLVNRALQGCWVLAALALLLVAAPLPGWGLAIGSVVFFLAMLPAFIGLGPLAYYLGAIADWAGESGLGQRYLAAAWGLAVFTSIYLLAVLVIRIGAGSTGLLGFLASGSALVAMFSAALSAIGFLLFLICNAQLTNTVRWALKNNLDAAERDIRIAERRAARASEAAERQAADIPIATPGPIGEPSVPQPPFPQPKAPERDDAPIPLVDPDPPKDPT
ncbi:MAG: hypothetical protein AAF138_06720 [Planctomycetota bacterium]